MAVDYATLKKGGFMRQKQKNHFSLRTACQMKDEDLHQRLLAAK